MRLKVNAVVEKLRGMGKLAVAFSGGVDSSVVAKLARLASADAVAFTVNDFSVSKEELAIARKVARAVGIKHVVIDAPVPEEILKNDRMRCYHCKQNIFRIMRERAPDATILDGSNADDSSGTRPGMMAARHAGVLSPLLDAGIGKKEVRRIASYLRLPNWRKPQTACLFSRIPTGTRITHGMLEKVEKGESAVKKLAGVSQARVRLRGDVAWLEVEEKDIPKIVKKRKELEKKLRAIGFSRVALDLRGYGR